MMLNFVEVFADGDGSRIWRAISAGCFWVIRREPGLPDWTDEQRARWVGYHASYSYREVVGSGPHPPVLRRGVFRTYAEAEDTCNAKFAEMIA